MKQELFVFVPYLNPSSLIDCHVFNSVCLCGFEVTIPRRSSELAFIADKDYAVGQGSPLFFALGIHVGTGLCTFKFQTETLPGQAIN